MTLVELLAAARLRLDDVATPYGWSDAELISWLNEAEREACIRARLLAGETTVSVVAGDGQYDLAVTTLYVRRARIAALQRLLQRTDRATLDARHADWQATTGDPTHYFIEGRELFLYPLPTVNRTLVLSVWRGPTGDMVVPATPPDPLVRSSPEIPTHHHLDLLEWVCYRAAQKRDPDTLGIGDAATYYANFSRLFGPAPSVLTQRAWLEHGGTGSVSLPT